MLNRLLNRSGPKQMAYAVLKERSKFELTLICPAHSPTMLFTLPKNFNIFVYFLVPCHGLLLRW